MKFSAEQIAGLVNGTIDGNPMASVSELAKIEEGFEGALSFLANPKYEEHIYLTKSSICIVNQSFNPSKPLPESLTLIRVADAYSCFAQLLELYSQLNKKQPEIESPVFISDSAIIGKDPYIGAFTYVSNKAVIGDNVTIYPNVFIGNKSGICNF